MAPRKGESHEAYLARNRETLRARRRADPNRYNGYDRRKRHGHGFAEAFAAMWDAQDGKCYLCGRVLILDADRHADGAPQMDHDHGCCGPSFTCGSCRRGLVCGRCNLLVGLIGDDPGLLRVIADNFEPVLLAARARIADTPVQQALGGP